MRFYASSPMGIASLVSFKVAGKTAGIIAGIKFGISAIDSIAKYAPEGPVKEFFNAVNPVNITDTILRSMAKTSSEMLTSELIKEPTLNTKVFDVVARDVTEENKDAGDEPEVNEM